MLLAKKFHGTRHSPGLKLGIVALDDVLQAVFERHLALREKVTELLDFLNGGEVVKERLNQLLDFLREVVVDDFHSKDVVFADDGLLDEVDKARLVEEAQKVKQILDAVGALEVEALNKFKRIFLSSLLSNILFTSTI